MLAMASVKVNEPKQEGLVKTGTHCVRLVDAEITTDPCPARLIENDHARRKSPIKVVAMAQITRAVVAEPARPQCDELIGSYPSQ